MKFLRSHLLALALSGLFLTAAQAAPVASISKVEGATVTLNRGQDTSLATGTHLYITRAGKSLAEVEVKEVGATSAQARIVRVFGSDSVLAGDLVTTEQMTGVYTTPGVVGGPPANVSAAPINPARMQFRPLPLDLTLEDAEHRYKESYETRSQHKEFTQVITSARDQSDMLPALNAMNVYMTADLLATSFGPGGFYGDPSYLLMSAMGAIEGKKARDKMFEPYEVKVRTEVTLWDQELLESYGQYAALVNGFSEPNKYQDFMRNLAAQKGLNGGRVFEVRIRNIGQLKAQLSPFNWHMFMVGPNQSRVGAVRYDAPLDRLIEPGREVSGNVYFPIVPSSGSRVQVVMEDIYGARGELEFSIDR